tara:strand:- start:1841 stop:1975 length:135 start_codon:yes stop_codon:yes gene_type:complete
VKIDVSIATEITNAPSVRIGRQRVGMAYLIKKQKQNSTKHIGIQ